MQYTSPVSFAPEGERSRASTLPLPVLGRILEHLQDDVSDLARVTRTSKLLYYMTLPSLYKSVALHSYPEIRYINGRPEGYGSGSPLMMALNGLVTKSYAALVEDFRVWGQWSEVGVEDFAKGRVPDNSMMLNILLRAAMDKMVKKRQFSWELDCKPLKTLYQGLATHTTLTSLTIKFPNSRVPRPSVIIPPIPSLRVFKATDIDPLCYPDDIGMLLLHSKRLEDVRIHFSPRMRREAEPTLNFETYFGRCTKANYLLKVKHFAIQNFFGPNVEGMNDIFDPATCQSCCFIDTFGGVNSPSRNIYLDDTWRNLRADWKTDFRTVRCNELATQHIQIISRASGMEHMYFIGSKRSQFDGSPMTVTSPLTPNDTPPADSEVSQLGKEYLYALTRYHGSTLKHLLLYDQWNLTPDDLGEVIRYCPNLEQLGLSLGAHNKDVMRLLLPFLPKLQAIRVLPNAWINDHFKDVDLSEEIASLSRDLYKIHPQSLRWIGLADQVIFNVTGRDLEIVNADGIKEMRKEVLAKTVDDVQHVQIWGLDTLDISADPVARFNP